MSSSLDLHKDLLNISQWTRQWKIFPNLDISKQAPEGAFSQNKIITNISLCNLTTSLGICSVIFRTSSGWSAQCQINGSIKNNIDDSI